MIQSNSESVREEKKWVRIPNGTKVRVGTGGRDGTIDGLTELVTGSRRNPDGRTQYRINVGEPERTLAVEDDLVSVGVAHERHVADAGVERLHVEGDALRLELPAGLGHVGHA